jgi:hypothetical protein
MYWLPAGVEDLLEPAMKPYGQHPSFCFDKINFGRPPAPWVFVCLDREYELAGHIATARPPDAGINFTSYTPVPNPMPRDFVLGGRDHRCF